MFPKKAMNTEEKPLENRSKRTMLKFLEYLPYIFLTIIVFAGFLYILNRYFFAWTNRFVPFGCSERVLWAKPPENLLGEKIELNDFFERYKNTPDYNVTLYGTGNADFLRVAFVRVIDDIIYTVSFEDVYRSTKDRTAATLIQMKATKVGANSFAHGVEKYTPDYRIMKGLRKFLDELPVDDSIKESVLKSADILCRSTANLGF